MHGGAGWKHRGGIYRGHNVKLHVNSWFYSDIIAVNECNSQLLACAGAVDSAFLGRRRPESTRSVGVAAANKLSRPFL